MNQRMKAKKHIMTFSVICLFTLLVGAICISKNAYAQDVNFQAAIDGVSSEYTTNGITTTIDGNIISTEILPSIKINKIWMVSVEEVFGKGLGCTFEINNKKTKLTLTNPNTAEKAVLTVGSNKAIINDEEYLLSMPVLEAKNESGVVIGYLVSVIDFSEEIGFSCSYKKAKKELSIKTTTFFDVDVPIPEYDTAIYSNVLSTVMLSRDSAGKREELQFITTNMLSNENITISEDEANGIITYTLLNTYNAIGYLYKADMNSTFVREITVKSSGKDTIITVKYNNQYTYMSLLEEEGVVASFSSSTYSMKVDIPEGVLFNEIKDVDQYHKKKFYFEIPGDWISYYESNPVIANHNQIKSVQTKLTDSGNTRIVIKTKKLQGYKMSEKIGYFTVQIGDPQEIFDSIVVLDAGHGGYDDGASKNGTKEKDLNFKIIYKKAKKYFNSRDSKVKAYWTRSTDTFISLSERAKFAQKVGADLFISLHMNSAYSSAASGMEIYYSKENNKATSSGLTSKKMAKKMLKALKKNLKESKTRGVKTARYYVTYHNTVPAILIELGFLSNSSDYSKITSDKYQTETAKTIYNCVTELFEAYPTERASERE